MTDWFEVHERDGAARLGELRLADPVTTPAMVEDVDANRETGAHRILRDAGSLWPAEREVPEGDDGTLTVLPHRAFPAGTEEEVTEAFAVDYPDVDFPSAAVVSTGTADDLGADAYLLSEAPGVVGHASAFVEAITETREAIPGDTALFLSGVATPGNVATLVYAGVDLVDPALAVVRGTQGRYLTTDGEYRLDDLTDLPCSCSACRGTTVEAFDREDCVTHNCNALAAELARVRERIRAGRLRDYLEGQVRHEGWQTATLRRLDDRWGYVEERAPVFRTTELTATTDDALRRPEIRRFADRVTSRYRNRFDCPLVLLPCSARKPYSESQSHGQFYDAIDYRAHVVSMTSPIGVVPTELECTYPAQHYDAAVTGRWSATEVEFVADVLEAYLERNDYPRVVAHVPPEGYRDAVERAADSLGLDVKYTVTDHPTTADSLANLAGALERELRYSKRKREQNTVRAVADYAFGDGAGDDLFPEFRLEGHYPKFRVVDDGEQLAAMVPEYGLLALTLAGGRRWVESSVPTRRVTIDDFVPHGSVLAPGVVEADDGIRVGDEVVIEGPEAFAVGRARMTGPEMAESTRGVAASVRHVEER